MEDRILLLMKFGKEDNIKSLQKGKIYCKRLSYYAELEEKTGNKSMGDRNEGKHVMTKCTFNLLDKETGKQLFSLESTKATFETEETNAMPVFCMVAIKSSNLQKNNDSEERYEFSPSKLLKDMIEESYWESALVITHQSEFFNRILNKCEANKIEVNGRTVNYTDMNVNYIDREEDISKKFSNVAFWKDNSYKGQYEYRIAFENISTEDEFILDIGDISDISKFFSREELIKFISSDYLIEVRPSENTDKVCDREILLQK